MNVYEHQLRAGIAALMGPAESLAQRNAQLQGLHALLNVHDVATLLEILTAERREALEVLSSVIELTSPDNPAWPRAVQLAERVFATLQASGMACEDEGCPHYGTPHGHIEPPPAGNPVSTTQAPPIPSGVYYDVAAYRFRECGTAKDMGYDFYTRWQARALEFPTAPVAPAPSYVNPASKRELQPGMPRYNDGSRREGS